MEIYHEEEWVSISEFELGPLGYMRVNSEFRQEGLLSEEATIYRMYIESKHNIIIKYFGSIDKILESNHIIIDVCATNELENYAFKGIREGREKIFGAAVSKIFDQSSLGRNPFKKIEKKSIGSGGKISWDSTAFPEKNELSEIPENGCCLCDIF